MNYSPRQLGDLTPTNPNRRQGLLAVFPYRPAAAGGSAAAVRLRADRAVLGLGRESRPGRTTGRAHRACACDHAGHRPAQPATLRRWSPWLYGVGLLMLIAVLVFGEVGKGAQRWLDLGIVRFQPSEMVKLAVPLMIAWYLAEKRLPPSWQRLTAAAADDRRPGAADRQAAGPGHLAAGRQRRYLRAVPGRDQLAPDRRPGGRRSRGRPRSPGT